MATIKSYTDLQQSKKLAVFLPLESADMYHPVYEDNIPVEKAYPKDGEYLSGEDIECWSLAALLNVIRETIGYVTYGLHNVYISCELGDFRKIETEVYDNEVDACVAMIEKLHELKML